jgi:hypothetical protein
VVYAGIRMRKILIAGAVLIGGLAIAQAVQRSLFITVNGAVSSEKAIVVAGKSYVPVSVLKSFGVNVKTSGNTLALSRAGASTPSNSGAAGTQQLAGGVGAIGKAVTVGKQSPLNFTLRSLEYKMGRIAIGREVYQSSAKQKLLLMRFTAQNPQKNVDVTLSSSSFIFTTVDSSNVSVTPNWAGGELAIARDNDFTPVDTPLKPGQRLDVYTVFVVLNNVSVPKLVVERYSERTAGVVRFDLTGKIKGLPAPFAADSNGFKSLEEITAKIGTFYPVGLTDFKLESAEISMLEPGDVRPTNGRRFVRLTFAIKNSMPRGAPNARFGLCGGEGFILEFTDAENERRTAAGCGENFLKAARNESGDGELTPGQETKVRYLFEVLDNVAAAKLVVYNEKSIRYNFDIGTAK